VSHLLAFIPQCEAYGWNGGPEFKTRIRVLQNGRERRNADWASARHRYNLPFQNIGPEGYAGIRQLFEVCRGMLHTFLYRDPLNAVAVDEVFAVSDGRGTYQLSTLSIVDGVSYQRPVYALFVPGDDGTAIPVDPVVTADGAPITVVVDHERGTVTRSPDPPGDVLRWSGEYAVWARFNHDWLPMSIDNRRADGHAINGAVELIEDAAPEAAS
jgi:uncharacterized protein (TIGR02217 family)